MRTATVDSPPRDVEPALGEGAVLGVEDERGAHRARGRVTVPRRHPVRVVVATDPVRRGAVRGGLGHGWQATWRVRSDRSSPARGPSGPRARLVHRRAVRRPAARRPRRRGDQGRAARYRGPDAGLGCHRRRRAASGGRRSPATSGRSPIDLRTELGRALVRDLTARVDVVIENFKPGTLDRWGMDHATLSAANPGLVLVHVSGFGQTGPRAHEPGFGAIGEAMGGIRHTTGDADRPPARAGISLGDALGRALRGDRDPHGGARAARVRDAVRRWTSRSTRRCSRSWSRPWPTSSWAAWSAAAAAVCSPASRRRTRTRPPTVGTS